MELTDKSVMAILRDVSRESAAHIVDTLLCEGVYNIEVSLSNERLGYDCIETISKTFHEGQINLGAGTVLTVRQALKAVELGAKYLITPGFNEHIVQYALADRIEIIPGVFSPGEIARASELGIQVMKLFPAGILGPDYVKSLKGPFPDIELMGVGGIDADNVADYYKAGCFSFALGSSVVPRGAMIQDIPEIRKRTKHFMAALDSA